MDAVKTFCVVKSAQLSSTSEVQILESNLKNAILITVKKFAKTGLK